MVAASDPVPAVISRGVMDRLSMEIVRAVKSAVPAALVRVVALAERVQAAPVPRISVIVHCVESPVTDWSNPFSVTPARVAPAVVAVRVPPETVDPTCSAIAGEIAPLSRIPVEPRITAAFMRARRKIS